jgi:hypothetical protein
MTVMCPALQEQSGVTRYLPRSGHRFVYIAKAVQYKVTMEKFESLYNEKRGNNVRRCILQGGGGT